MYYEVITIQIVLASASPRRSELLKQIGLDFIIVPSKIDEGNNDNLSPAELVQYLAYQKAMDVAEQMAQTGHNNRYLVIGADTVVVKDGIIGKPADRHEAFCILSRLRGGWHEVFTGIALIDTRDFKYIKGFETTRVKMKEMSDDTIFAYIDSQEPMDKAGAYGVQGKGAVLVERVEGCYFNVVGLPLPRLAELLKEFGVCVFKH
ncbi:MAG TPA: Maf family protein [Acetivibrio sp.]|nr:Maf family protein [Acetivibrio sp.]